jgi:hypothetical protein
MQSVSWPPLSEALSKVVAKKIPIYACGACSRARGITEADLTQYGAKFGNPKIFVSLVEWAGENNYRITVDLFQPVPSKPRRISFSLRPSMRSTLSRDLLPYSRTIVRSGMLNFSAKNLRKAAFAFPSTAGARSLILIASPCSPTTLSIFAFGMT